MGAVAGPHVVPAGASQGQPCAPSLGDQDASADDHVVPSWLGQEG